MPVLFLTVLLSASPSSPASVRDAMVARGVAPASVVEPFAATAAIGEFARQAVRDRTDDVARAHALYDAILALKRDGAIIGDRDNTPQARAPKTAVELLRIAKDEAATNRKAGCYEFSALFLAAGRTLGLEVVGVEREESAGTGQIGHVMAGVRFEAGGRLTVFDLQNESRGSRSRVRELDDLEMVAHHYNHLAVAAFLNAKLDEALAAIDIALRLAPDSPSFLNNRATVLAALGEPVLALAEAVAAVRRAPNVPLYRYQLGRLYMMTGEIALAVKNFGVALSMRPRYSLARRDRGWAMLLLGEPKRAEENVRRALREDPKTPDGALYLGLILLARGAKEEAATVAREAKPRDPELAALEKLARGVPDDSPETKRLRRVLRSVAAAQEGELQPLP